MPLKIPSEVKAAVIQDWLSGKPRDAIARDNSLSTGSVSNIIEEYRNAVSDADALRELGIMFRKLGITAPQCAIGFRLASILKALGVNEEKFGDFVSKIYNECTDIGLKPEYIAYNTKQILDLSGSIPISEIPDYIQEKTKERRKLEENIKKLEEDIKKLEGKKLEARTELMVALDENKVYLSELEQFSNLKAELDKHGLFIEDIQYTVRTINGAQKLGYNVTNFVIALFEWETLGKLQTQLQKSVRELTVTRGNLQKERAELERHIFDHRQKESILKELQGMGCGLKELKLIFGIIKEVATNRQIPEYMAVQKFFEDIEKNYDNKLGYDSTLERRRSEIEKTNMELNILQLALGSLKKVVRALSDIVSIGYDEQQILNLAWALQSNTSNKESLEADLNKYGSLKKGIEGLEQKLRNLESQANPMELKRDSINIPKDPNEVMPMQEYAALAPNRSRDSIYLIWPESGLLVGQH